MAVKILIARQVADGGMDAVKALIDTMRQAASGQSGFILAEAFVPQWRNKQVMVISSWQSIDDWNRWFDHPLRVQLQKKMDGLLEGRTTYTLYLDQ